MYITYHREVGAPKEYIPMAHNILNKEIQDFIAEYHAYQEYYKVRSNASNFFIYLDSGDRIDIQY